MIGGDSKSRVVWPHCHAGPHTQTPSHIFTQYVHPSMQHTKKWDFLEPNGVGVGKSISII